MSRSYRIGHPQEYFLQRGKVDLEVKNGLQVQVMKLFGCNDTNTHSLTEQWIKKAAPVFDRLLSPDCPASEKGQVAKALQLYGGDTDAAAKILKGCLIRELGGNFMQEYT